MFVSDIIVSALSRTFISDVVGSALLRMFVSTLLFEHCLGHFCLSLSDILHFVCGKIVTFQHIYAWKFYGVNICIINRLYIYIFFFFFEFWSSNYKQKYYGCFGLFRCYCKISFSEMRYYIYVPACFYCQMLIIFIARVLVELGNFMILCSWLYVCVRVVHQNVYTYICIAKWR